MVSWDLPPPVPPALVGRPGGAPRSALVLAGLAVPRHALLQQPSPCPALPSGGESSGQRGVSSRAGTRGALCVPTAAGLPSPAPHGSNLSPVLSLPKSKQRSCASPQGPSRCCFAPLVAQALSPSPAAPRGRPARPCHLPPHAASGKHDGSVIKPASLSRSRVVERQRRASQPGALLVRRPERAACTASPAPRAGLGRCFNGRVWRGAWAARGRALPPARRWGHGACLSPRARPRGAGPGSQDRVSAPFPHGTVLGKELALACWAGAKAGNYNLLAQIPPAVSEVRSSWLAPSALVPLLRSRDCIWVLNEATRPRQGLGVLCASRARRRWRLLAPDLVLWCRVGSAESRRSWGDGAGSGKGSRPRGPVAALVGVPRGQAEGNTQQLPTGVERMCPESRGGRGWWWLFRRGEGAQIDKVGFGAGLPAPSSPRIHPRRV